MPTRIRWIRERMVRIAKDEDPLGEIKPLACTSSRKSRGFRSTKSREARKGNLCTCLILSTMHPRP